MLLTAERWNQNMPKLTTSIKTATITSIAGERTTSPPLPMNEEAKSAEIVNIGIVSAPEKTDARAILPAYYRKVDVEAQLQWKLLT